MCGRRKLLIHLDDYWLLCTNRAERDKDCAGGGQKLFRIVLNTGFIRISDKIIIFFS